MPDTQIAEVTITLPDGATRTYATGTTVAEVAGSISKSLLKRSIGARIDGEVRDLSTPLTKDLSSASRMTPKLRRRVGCDECGDEACAHNTCTSG